MGDQDEPQGITLIDLWSLTRTRRVTLLVGSVVGAALSLGYAVTTTTWYRAESLLAAAEQANADGLSGQLGTLAQFAGVNVNASEVDQSLAVLESRSLIRELLIRIDAVDEVYEMSLGFGGRIRTPEKENQMELAVEYFKDSLLMVSRDRNTGLIEASIEWHQPQLAASWLAEMIAAANDRLRTSTIEESDRNLQYLREKLASVNSLPLQQTIASLMEAEMQRNMLAKGRENFAFEVIDPPTVPFRPVRPRKPFLLLIGTFAGFASAMFVVVLQSLQRSSSRNRRDL